MNNILQKTLPVLVAIMCILGFQPTMKAHSVQLAYCGNCGGNLRLWVEHWHGNANPGQTQMTISLTVGGITTVTNGAPIANIQNTPLNQLPGCTTAPVVFAACAQANTHNDWVNYDFLGVQCGVPVSITVIQGHTVFTADACGMMPAATPVFVIPCVQASSANFVPPLPVCVGTQQQFIDQSGPVGQITWHWNFGTGNPADTSNLQHPNFTFPAAGTYNVKLTVTTVLNCPDDTIIQVTVEDIPAPNFSANIGCSGSPTTFADLSTITFGTITNWQWDFGDTPPATSNVQNPTHTYLNGGQYTVKLITTSSGGCVDSISKVIDVPYQPVALLSMDTLICYGKVANFTNLSTIPAGGTWSHIHWDFGVPNPVVNDTSNQNNPTYQYALPGTYTVTLTVVGVGGCDNIISKTIVVQNAPQTEFSVAHVCHGAATTFNDLSTTPVGAVGIWNWNFGDGAGTSAIQNPTYTYLNPGSYTVKLVNSVNGVCPDSMERVVHVHDVPIVDFSGDILSGCNPVCTDFTNLTTLARGTVATWVWNLGDGTTEGNQTSNHCYENLGQGVRTFDVTLTATSDSGCVDMESKTSYINVYPVPVASFNPDPDIVNVDIGEIKFENRSAGATIHMWDFGDGTNSTGGSPKHTYQDTGKYIVWLYEENQWGCRDSTWKPIKVNPVWHVHIPNAFTPGEDLVNNMWKAETFGITEMTTMVFDRWGEKLWEGVGLDAAWDGKSGGKTLETETYVYRIVCETILGEHKEFRGRITLLR